MESRIRVAIAILVTAAFAVTLARGRLRTLVGTWDRRENPRGYWAALSGSAIGIAILVWQYLTH